MKPVKKQATFKKPTDDCSSGQPPLRGIVLLVKSTASKNAQFAVVIFQLNVENFQFPAPVTATVTELRIAPAAYHVITTAAAFNVDLHPQDTDDRLNFRVLMLTFSAGMSTDCYSSTDSEAPRCNRKREIILPSTVESITIPRKLLSLRLRRFSEETISRAAQK